MIIRTIDEDAAHAGRAHLSEGDFLWAGEGWHALLKRGSNGHANRAITLG